MRAVRCSARAGLAAIAAVSCVVLLPATAATGQALASEGYRDAGPGVSGAELWLARYDGPGGGFDFAQSVAVSPGGATVFITGSSPGLTSGADYATVAYDAATGAQLWASRYSGPGNADDHAGSVGVSPGGGTVFVTGGSTRTGAITGDDYVTIAYNAATGARRWLSRYNGHANLKDFAHSLATGPGGREVFVTGASHGRRSGVDYATVAYNAATGAQLWARRYNGPGNNTDEPASVAAG